MVLTGHEASCLPVMYGLQHDNQTARKGTIIGEIDSLNKTAFSIFRNDPAHARSIAREALAKAIKINYQIGEGKALNYIGIICHISGEYDSASAYYTRSLEIFSRIGDSVYIGKIYNNLAFLNSDRGYQNLCLDYNLKSLEIARKSNDAAELVKCYTNIGLAYTDMDKDDQALGFYNDAVALSKDDPELKKDYFIVLANIGVIHMNRREYPEAVDVFNKVLSYADSAGDNVLLEQTSSFIGRVYIKTNRADAATKSFDASDHYAGIISDRRMLAENQLYRGELELALKNWQDADKHYHTAFDLADSGDFLTVKMNALFGLARIDSMAGDFKRAFEDYRSAVSIRDSLNSKESKNQIAELNIRYESLQKDQLISSLRQEHVIQELQVKKSTTYRNFLLIILIILAGFVAYFFDSRKRIRKVNLLLEARNQEIASKNRILEDHQLHLEEIVKTRTDEYLAAKVKAEESDRLKSAFLANMSHEIRTPLNGILGFMELIEDRDTTPEDQDNYFQIIRKSSDRLVNTINNIMDFSKIESGQMDVSLSRFDPAERLAYLVDFFRPEAMRKGLEIRFLPDSYAQSTRIISDKDKLDAIMANLIKNAIKYTQSGSIETGFEIRDNTLHFYVKDTWIGIPQERISSVFDRFIQINDPLHRSFEGSGLGLAICKAYVDMLSGELTVESVINQGSVFRFRIPVTITDSFQVGG